MTDVDERVKDLLTEALALLDKQGAELAAIHVSHALDMLGYPITEADRSDAPAG